MADELAAAIVEAESAETTAAEENRDEGALFRHALEEAMTDPAIASVIADYYDESEVVSHIDSSRNRIWSLVTEQRRRYRNAAAALKKTEETLLSEAEVIVRRDQPELASRYEDALRLEDELTEQAKYFSKLAGELRETDNSGLTSEVDRLADKLDSEINEAIRRCNAWLELTAAPRDLEASRSSVVSGEDRNRRLLRTGWLRQRSASPTSSQEPESRYQQILEPLAKFRRVAANCSTALKRFELQLSIPAREIMRGDERFRAAQAEYNTARTALKTSLLHDAVLPELRRFINARASEFWNLRMRVREAAGLYEPMWRRDPVVTPAIRNIAQTLERMKGVSLGLAGPRGSGKTTAIEYFCDPDSKWMVGADHLSDLELDEEKTSSEGLSFDRRGRIGMVADSDLLPGDGLDEDEPTPEGLSSDRRGRIGMVVSAPIEYIARDFILYLYAKLCITIAGDRAEEEPSTDPDAADSSQADNRWAKRAWLISSAAGSAALLAAATIMTTVVSGHPAFAYAASALTAVSGVLISAFPAYSFPRRTMTSPEDRYGGSFRIRRWFPALIVSQAAAIALALTGSVALSGTAGLILWTGGLALFTVFSSSFVTLGSPWEKPLEFSWGSPSESAWTDHNEPIIAMRSNRWRSVIYPLSALALFAAVSGGLALTASRFPPVRPAMLLGGCTALLAAAAAYLPLGETLPNWAVIIGRALRAMLVIGGLVAAAAAYLHIASQPGILLAAAIGIAGAVIVISPALSSVTWRQKLSQRADLRSLESTQRYQRLRDAEAERPGVKAPSQRNDYPRHSKYPDPLIIRAIKQLREIRFQQTMNTGRTQGLNLGTARPVQLGVSSQYSRGLSWTRQPPSFPEIVGQFRDFVADLAEDYQLHIGIDELDKLPSQSAERFLNDIKAIFGIRGCHFLISVSEEAASGFERRGVPFRDVFDSSFDDVIPVGYLDHQTSAVIIDSRVVGLSRPFVWLCHVLAGGLARDLIRVTRSLLLAPHADQETLAQACSRLCREELVSKTHGICRELALMSDNMQAADLLTVILNCDLALTTADTHFSRSTRLRSWMDQMASAQKHDTDGTVLRRATELATFAYFTGTVCEFFSERLTRERVVKALQSADQPLNIERLAAARQAMTASLATAQSYLIGFREAWGETEPPKPDTVDGK